MRSANDSNVRVGLSDHSGEIFAGLAAVTLGADVLEVHVTLSREMFGPDVAASITTSELRQLVRAVRQIERIINNPVVNRTRLPNSPDQEYIFEESLF